MPHRIKAHTVITAHTNADFDALAAIVAASKLYPDAVLVFPGSQEKNLRNFFIQSTTYLFNFKTFKDINPETVELLVVVDTRQASRVQHVKALLDKPGLRIHLYDHHPDTDEDLPAEKSVVKTWGSTTTILVHEFMDQEGVDVFEEEATMLGLGIFEDTGSFTFNSTTPHDFTAAAWLRARGMDLNVIADILSRELSSEQVSLLNDMLAAAKTYDIHGIEVVITEADAERYVGDFAFLVHKLLDMENIRVLFALARMDDRVHLVARSRTPDVDVGQICAHFGGGGHAYAASASIKDKTTAEARDELFILLSSHIHPQKSVETLMNRAPVCVSETDSIERAVEVMTRFGLKGVPVTAPDSRRVVGLMEHKIADKAASHGLGHVAVGEYMLRDFRTIAPDADLYKAMDIIVGQRQRMVPVVAEGEMVGVMTRTDLINVLIQEPARIPESLLPDKQRDRNIGSTMRNRLPASLIQLLDEAGRLGASLGHEVYAVGGFVRDILLARPNLDLDLVVEGDGVGFAQALAERHGGRVKPHHKFKTAVVVLPGGQRVDVATARLEYYEFPAALPVVELSSIKMDLYRRDFTVNALALHLNPGSFGRLVDFFGAQRDIKERTIRVLHSLSFVEDPTRILRAIRFEQRFSFRIGGQTDRLIRNAVQLNIFDRLSGARLFHELKLIFEESSPLNCLRRMQEFKLLRAILPELELDAPKEEILEELEKVASWYNLLYLEPKPTPWKLYLLGMTRKMDSPKVVTACDRLSLSGRERREFLQLKAFIYQATPELMAWNAEGGPLSRLHAILSHMPVESLLFLMARSRTENVRKHISLFLTRLRHVKLDVTGKDLIALGIPTGPQYTAILKRLMAAKLDEEASTRQEQLALARRLAMQVEERE
jgi:tRNA nucleotidyltransferase (CCA-adding enzyme)